MEKAVITLKGPLSLAVGRFRFMKDTPVTCTDKDLIGYARRSPHFKVDRVSVDDPSKVRKRSSARNVRKVKKETETEIKEDEIT